MVIAGNIFNIQRYCIHDGPGIRTTVFFKGCEMKCFWCHNPEALNNNRQLQFISQKCNCCMKCLNICSENAHEFISNADYINDFSYDTKNNSINNFFKTHSIKRDLCNLCGKCVDVCFTEALLLRGYDISLDDLIGIIERDFSYYLNSGGGVTFSGGEPLLQHDFLKAILIECKKRDIHTAIQTAGYAVWDIINSIKKDVDLWMYDIKCMDIFKHYKATGVNNTPILENLKGLIKSGSDIIVRIPIVPGFNDSEKEMENIRAFLVNSDFYDNPSNKVKLLPFNNISNGKYESLGLSYKASYIIPPSRERISELELCFT